MAHGFSIENSENDGMPTFCRQLLDFLRPESFMAEVIDVRALYPQNLQEHHRRDIIERTSPS
ncbi:hypothetical protein D3C71_1967900 [compost metagenome]